MFGFIKKMSSELSSAGTLGIFGKSLAFNSKGTLKLVSLNNEPCHTRPTVVNIDSDETLFFYLFTVRVAQCDRSCNTIDDQFARVCVLNEVKVRI